MKDTVDTNTTSAEAIRILNLEREDAARVERVTGTVYLSFTTRQQWEFSARDICPFCGLQHDATGSCRARFCDSCTAYWLAELGDDNGEGRPVNEYCPECLLCDCGNELDETNAGERCDECVRQAEIDAAWNEYRPSSNHYREVL